MIRKDFQVAVLWVGFTSHVNKNLTQTNEGWITHGLPRCFPLLPSPKTEFPDPWQKLKKNSDSLKPLLDRFFIYSVTGGLAGRCDLITRYENVGICGSFYVVSQTAFQYSPLYRCIPSMLFTNVTFWAK